jgi:Bacterial Ig-like domain (group 3)
VKIPKLLPSLGAGVALLVGIGTAVAVAPAAFAATQIGTMSLIPPSGDQSTAPNVDSSAACPAGAGRVEVGITGGSGAGAVVPAGHNLIGIEGISIVGTNAAGGVDMATPQTWQSFAQAIGLTNLNGAYTLTIECINGTSGPANNDLGDFVGTVTFVGTSTSSATYTTPAPAAPATATTLTAAPPSPQTLGTSVTLTANVTSTAGTTVGSVTFEDGGSSIGTGTVDGSGNAVFSTNALAVGTHPLTAVFNPTDATAFATSTSAALSYVITGVPAVNTSTALSVNPTTGAAFTPVALTATVTPASGTTVPTGSVQFFDGTASLGTAPLAAGVASLSVSSLAQGTHSITAVFTAADPTKFNTSTSPAVVFTATAPTFTPDAQTIKAEVAAGTLTITTPFTPANPFDLGALVLNASGTELSTTGNFGTIVVTDTRAGDVAWTAAASSTDFSDGATPADLINGENLGLTALVGHYTAGNALQAGSVTFTDNPAAAGVSATDGGTLGLKGGPHVFAHAPLGDGTVGISGTLTLNAPTSTVAGTYTATLTFTVS